MNTQRRERIVILGGGCGAMAAAWALSHPDHGGKQYDLTVYQMGWRLGGKGASGRNLDPAYHYRIEEHGVHMWSGLYDNAFRVIRECYEELGRAPDAPLGTWNQAFTPQNFLAMVEQYKGRQVPWVFQVPMNDELPGEPDAKLTLPLWSYLLEGVQMMRIVLKSARSPARTPPTLEPQMPPDPVLPASGLGRLIGRGLTDVLLWLASILIRFLPFVRLIGRIALFIMSKAMKLIWNRVLRSIDDDYSRRVWLLLNFTYGNLAGMIREDVFRRGLDFLDEYDYREWLSRYIIDDTVDGVPLTLCSPMARSLYDAQFAYVDGNLSKPSFGAGSYLKTLLRMAFTWKGALIWRMRAGMGDVVFAPFYEALKRRNVRFEFFHCIKNMELSEDKQRIHRIRVAVQARLRDPTRGYEPLMLVNGLPCWPSVPLWSQLDDGERLQREGVNFESYTGPEIEELVLEEGRDFDRVVLAIPVGGLPYIASELIQASPRWKDMVDRVLTVRTQAAQLWLQPTTYQLGWAPMGWPLLSTFAASPLNTWADMSDLSVRESWPPELSKYPLSIAYFCGPMADDPPLRPGPNGPVEDLRMLDQRHENEKARQTARLLLSTSMGWLWPQATTPPWKTDAPLDWSLLVDDRLRPGRGEDRLGAQYFRANVSPSERFVLTVAGSTKYRIRPGDTGFDNLVIAGDWTDNGFNIGNVESTVMSGLLASNAISGYPRKDSIVGLDFGRGPQEAGK
jgi:uncharacterized protein with NAD-binding domain and iron-sulfur cluster